MARAKVIVLVIVSSMLMEICAKKISPERRELYRDDVKKKVPPPPAKPFEGDPNLGIDDDEAWFVDEEKVKQSQETDTQEKDDFPGFIADIFGDNDSYEKKPNYEEKPYSPSPKPQYNDYGSYEKPYKYEEEPYKNSYEEEYEKPYNSKPYKPQYQDDYKPVKTPYDKPVYEDDYKPEKKPSYSDTPYNDEPYRPTYDEKPYRPGYAEDDFYKPQYGNKPYDEKPYKTGYKKPQYTPAFVQDPVELKPSSALSPKEYQKEEYHALHEKHGYKSDSKANSIPGRPGEDYPNYTAIPPTNFKCKYDEAYGDNVRFADPETRCQVFHVCMYDRMESFLCPLGTIFDQETQQCGWWYDVYCKY